MVVLEDRIKGFLRNSKGVKFSRLSGFFGMFICGSVIGVLTIFFMYKGFVDPLLEVVYLYCGVLFLFSLIVWL